MEWPWELLLFGAGWNGRRAPDATPCRKSRSMLRCGRRGSRDGRRPSRQIAPGAGAPERLQVVPVFEEGVAAAGTGEARHPDPGPADRGEPDDRDHRIEPALREQQAERVG